MIKRFIERYQAVYVLAIIIVIIGTVSYIQLPRESAPEIRRPLIFVTTTYAGVAAKDIESLISKPIEDELDGLEGLEKLNSTSTQGLSSITAEFSGDTDVEIALRRVKERVDVVKPELPVDADEPFVRELNFSDQPFLIVVLSNPNGLEVLDRITSFLEEEIKSIAGVLDAKVSGKQEKELAIELDPTKLKLYGLAIDDIIGAIQSEHITIPGGTLRNDRQQLTLSVTGELTDQHDFDDIVVNVEGKKVKLKSLGSVEFKYKDRETIAKMNGHPAISIAVTKRSGENLLEIVDRIKKLVEDTKPDMPFGTKITYSFDESRYIKDMVYDLENNIISAFVLVVLVTLFFLGPINALFVSICIPFSMLMSFSILQFLGITLNMMVLFSLVLALGMLVDNGIVIVENVYRHRSLGKDKVQAAIDGAREVLFPVVSSTLTTILAFFPIIFMPDIMGEFMSYLPKTVIIVLSSSLFVSFVITTTVCSRFLNVRRQDIEALTSGSSAFQKLVKFYEKLLNLALEHPFKTIAGMFAVVILGIILNGILGKAPIFFPTLDPEVGIISIETPPGTSLALTDNVADKIEGGTNKVPSSLENIQITTGRGVGGFGSVEGSESNKANLRLGFKPYLQREIPAKQTLADLKEVFKDFTDAKLKIQELQDGPPQGHAISYEITGQDYGVLGGIADRIMAIIEKHEPAFETIDHDYEAGKPEIRIEIDREKASQYGLNTRLIASTVRNSINGTKVGTYRKGKDEYDVVVRYGSGFRKSLNNLKELEIIDKEIRVPLVAVARISEESSAGLIKRKNRRRAVNIWADFKPGFDDRQQVDAIAGEIAGDVAKLQLPAGYAIGSGEGNDVREKSTQFLVNAFFIAVLLIFLVLVTQFNSVTQPAIILISVFLSLGGVFWGLLIFRQTFVIIMTGIGVVSLAGVVVNNAIVLIDFINLQKATGIPIKEAIVEACKTRLRPVLLTAITTVIGLLPMAYGISFDFHIFSLQIGSESAQWFKDMAWAIIYGLSFATLLTLVIVPVMILIDYRFRVRIRGWIDGFASRPVLTVKNPLGLEPKLPRFFSLFRPSKKHFDKSDIS